MNTVKITNWRIAESPKAPNRRVLFGIPINHPGPFIENGVFMMSSAIAKVDLKKRKVFTNNTEYSLVGPELELFEFMNHMDEFNTNKNV